MQWFLSYFLTLVWVTYYSVNQLNLCVYLFVQIILEWKSSFYSNLKSIYKTFFDAMYTPTNITKRKLLKFSKKHWQIKHLEKQKIKAFSFDTDLGRRFLCTFFYRPSSHLLSFPISQHSPFTVDRNIKDSQFKVTYFLFLPLHTQKKTYCVSLHCMKWIKSIRKESF